MQTAAMKSVLDHLRKRVGMGVMKDLTDAELLERFCGRREEAAFALLLQRHGPAVLGVCRGILDDAHAAEDAFQATFLVLVRKAGSVRKRSSLGSFLHGVALRTAVRVRGQAVQRRARERQAVAAPSQPGTLDALSRAEACAVLHEELGRLPDKYRRPLVLCYLEDKTHEQAAGELAWPKSSVSSRLKRGCELLRQRLSRRGVALPAGVLAVLLAEQTARAVPALLTLATVRLAVQALADGPTLATAAVGVANGLLKAVTATRRGALFLLLLTVGLAVAGVGVLASQPEEPKTEPPPSVVQPAKQPVAPPKKAEELRDCFNNPLPKGAVARLGTVDFRHGDGGGRNSSLTFSPDGKYLVSAGDSRVTRWQVATGSAVISFGDWGRNGEPGFTAVVTADTKIARIRFDNAHFAEYDLESGKERTYRQKFPRTEGSRATPPILSPDGKTFAELNFRGSVALMNTVDGEITHTLEPAGGPYTALTYAPDGKTLVVGDDGHTFHVFDPATGTEERSFGPLKGNRVGRMAISPDGKWLVTAGGKKGTGQLPISQHDRFLRVWDLQKGTEVRTLEFPEDRGCQSLTFTPDSRTVIAGLRGYRTGSGEAVRTWDLASGKPGRAWTDEPKIGLTAAVSPDGKRLATMNGSGVIRFWDMETGKEHKPLAASPSAVDAVCFRPDGKTLLTVGDDGAVREWEATTGKLLDLRRARVKGSQGTEWRFGPGGNLLTAGFVKGDDSAAGNTAVLQLDDLATGKRLTEQHGHGQVLSADGKRMAFRVPEGRIKVFDIESGKVIHTIPPPEKKPLAGKYWPVPRGFTPDGKSLIVRGDSISVWDVESGEQKTSWDLKDVIKEKPLAKGRRPNARIETIVVSPDATKMAIAGFEDKYEPAGAGGRDWIPYVLIVETATGKLLHRIDPEPALIEELAFSPDGKVLAGAGVWTVHLWDVGSGKSLAQFEGHRARVKSLAFSPDGKRLASASEDSTVLIWDCSR